MKDAAEEITCVYKISFLLDSMAYSAKEFHFIDTSIFVSILKNDANADICKKYFARVKNNLYKAHYSHLVLGEVSFIIFREIEDSAKHNAITLLHSFLDDCISVNPKISDYSSYIDRYRHLEHRCNSTDVRLICEAIIGKFDKFITLDTKINSKDVDDAIEIHKLEVGSLRW